MVSSWSKIGWYQTITKQAAERTMNIFRGTYCSMLLSVLFKLRIVFLPIYLIYITPFPTSRQQGYILNEWTYLSTTFPLFVRWVEDIKKIPSQTSEMKSCYTTRRRQLQRYPHTNHVFKRPFVNHKHLAVSKAIVCVAYSLSMLLSYVITHLWHDISTTCRKVRKLSLSISNFVKKYFLKTYFSYFVCLNLRIFTANLYKPFISALKVIDLVNLCQCNGHFYNASNKICSQCMLYPVI